MMMTVIYQFLTSDTQLCTLLGHDPTNKVRKIFIGSPKVHNPSITVDEKSLIQFPYLVFDAQPFSINALKEYRLKITIVAKKEQLEAIVDRLIDLLQFETNTYLKINDTPILHSRFTTGGSLIFHDDLDVFEQVLYFRLKV
jgi:hypothetical protein